MPSEHLNPCRKIRWLRLDYRNLGRYRTGYRENSAAPGAKRPLIRERIRVPHKTAAP